MRKAVFTIAILTSLAGCQLTNKPIVATDETKLQGSWQLVSVNGQDYHSGHPVNFTIADNKLTGSDGCNRISGQFQLDNNQLNARLIATRKLCTPAEVMTLASSFHQLANHSQVSFKEDLLVLSSNETVMQFQQLLDSAEDDQGHGPDPGTSESINALVWQGKIKQAVREAFWMASQNGSKNYTLDSIKMSNKSSKYLNNEHAFMSLYDTLFSAIKAKKPSLTSQQWDQLWQQAPQQETLQEWVTFIKNTLR